MSFKDHFSARAKIYAEARPDYPAALFSWLQQQCRNHQLAWDCATGSGQAARALAVHFDDVIASDASASQVAAASGPANIQFRVFAAETPALEPESLDLITVAQALHWFAIDDFFAAADTVLKSDGVLAVWCYGLCQIDADTDALLTAFYEEVLGDYWPPERSLVEQEYATIDFPYKKMASPRYAMEKHWSCAQLLAYLRSWSATQRYERELHSDPVVEFGERLHKHWPAKLKKTVQWPLSLIVGRK